MFSVDKMHFEISERKMILRLFDVFFVLSALFVIGKIFDFDYFTFSTTDFSRAIVLAVYLNLFGTIFEIYNLQVASNQFQFFWKAIPEKKRESINTLKRSLRP